MTVKESSEYLLNNFDNNKKILIRGWNGDANGEFYSIDINEKNPNYNIVQDEFIGVVLS